MNASPRPSMTVPHSCKECKFLSIHAPSGSFVCRKNPPVVHTGFIPVNAGVGGGASVQVMAQTFWPIVDPATDWCDSFQPSVQQ